MKILGSSVIYLADSLVKLLAGSKLEEDKDYGIKGFMVNGIFLKSRSNEAGRPFELVFNQKIGFDDFYTNFNYLKKEKCAIIQGYYFSKPVPYEDYMTQVKKQSEEEKNKINDK